MPTLPYQAGHPFWSHSICVGSPDHPVSVPIVRLWNWNGVCPDAYVRQVSRHGGKCNNCQHSVHIDSCTHPTPHPSHRPPSPDGGSGPVPHQLFLLWYLSCLPGLLPRQQAPLFQGVTLCWAPCQLVCWSGTHFESQNWSEAWRKGMGMGIRYHLQCVASHLCTSLALTSCCGHAQVCWLLQTSRHSSLFSAPPSVLSALWPTTCVVFTDVWTDRHMQEWISLFIAHGLLPCSPPCS